MSELSNKPDTHPESLGSKTSNEVFPVGIPDMATNKLPADTDSDIDSMDTASRSKKNSEERETPEDENESVEGPSRKKMKKKSSENNSSSSSPQDEVQQSAIDDLDNEEVVCIPVGRKPQTGKIWKNLNSGKCLRYHCNRYNVDYKPGDTVYIESQKPTQPYYICLITELKMSKRETVMVHIKWFYRTCEVPEQVYQLLIQDRYTEHASGGVHPMGGQQETVQISRTRADIAALRDHIYKCRELFISEMTDVYPATVLRGLCNVQHCADLIQVKEFVPEENNFFYTLAYNPETRRVASTEGEIRVGAGHQAKLPEFQGQVPAKNRPEPKGEEISWSPERIHDHDLMMFLRAARSMAAFAAMCDGGSPDDGFQAASRDSITATAIEILHECDYDTNLALQNLLKVPFPSHDVFRKWPQEDIKNLIKGLRIHGKNFFKIRVEFLPERDTADLIEFYYFWKKTSGAANNRPRGRRHRRAKASKSQKAPRTDPNDPSSCSEGEEETGDKSDSEISLYYCRHCFTSQSKNWHHAGKDKLLLCYDCRLHFKRYAECPQLDGEVKRREIERMKEELEQKMKEEEEELMADMTAEVPPVPVKEELNLSAIEKDSEREEGAEPEADTNQNAEPIKQEPVEMKAELPKNVQGLFSPVATIQQSPTSQPILASPSKPSPDIQVLEHHRSSSNSMNPTINPSAVAANLPPREPSPPPKPDGTECHRSQSAIFTRVWNRGEGNSCSRTDMMFKPVPNSQLAKKREERLRKAAEREEALKAEANRRAQQEALAHSGQLPSHSVHSLFSPADPFRVGTPNPMPRPSPFPPVPHLPENRSHLYPPGFGPAPRPPPPQPSLMDIRAAERQYAERINALATDPLIRLQMAGVNPELPGSHFGAAAAAAAAAAAGGYGLRGAPGMRPPVPPTPGLDPRFRADLFLRNPTGYFPPDLVQRQLMFEREQSMLAAQQSAAQQSLLAQQEEFFRMEHEARARAAAAAAAGQRP